MKKACAAVLAIGIAILWAGGCQEEQASSSEKMARLTAVEDRNLRTQLQAENKNLQTQLQAEKKKREDEIKKLNMQSQVETKKKDDEIKKLSEQLEKARLSSQAEITKRDEEIKELNAEIKKRDEDVRGVSRQLEQCENTRDERVAKIIDKECKETVSKLLDWTAELSAEIERLKAGQAGVKGDTDK